MYRYSPSFDPPAPALDVEVVHPYTSVRHIILAKFDTAADQTLIPEQVAAALNLDIAGMSVAQPLDSVARIYVVYRVDLIIAGRQFIDLEAAAAPIDYILLGRDVLNELVITLDGPQRTFTIS